MSLVNKSEVGSIKIDQLKFQKYSTPGPGSYDVALPLIRPNYQAIRKNNDVVILKINHNGESCNFISEQSRFLQQKQRSPGPAQYDQNLPEKKNKKRESKKHSQRYSDLLQFMYRQRSQISPIPDYKVEYDNQYEKNLKRIKNSHRRHVQNQKIKTNNNIEATRKSLVFSKNMIISIQSKNMLAQDAIKSSRVNISRKNSSLSKYDNQNQRKTIDFPENSQKLNNKKRLFSLQKQQKLLLHRTTLYNRNMLGMMIAKASPRNHAQKQSQISQRNIRNYSTLDRK